MKPRVLSVIWIMGALFAGEQTRHFEVGRVFSIKKTILEVTGPGISRLSNGQTLIVATESGDIPVTVVEIYHSKVNCVAQGKISTIRAGDHVFLPGKKQAETQGITIGDPADENVKLYSP